MAHGFLAYEPVSGDNFWKNLGDVYKGLKKLASLYDTGNKILKANVRELDPKQLAAGKPAALPSGAPKALAAAPATRMLGAGSGSIVGKNPTNIDVKTGERPESGPRLPGGVGGGPSKGGGFTDIPGIASTGLNTQNFFSKAVNEGIDVNTGQYLSKEARIAAFKAGKVDRNASQGPSISPDSGVDIVAAVNRNTQMIVSLVDAVKTQTQNDSKLTEQQIQTQETLMLRSAAAQKEAALEQGGDYSGFMTPENFEKKKKEEKKKETGSKLKEFFRGPNPFKQPEGCGCSPFMPGPGGGRGILGGPPGGGGLPIPDYVDQKRDMMRRPSRLGGGASAMRRGGGARGLTRIATKVGGKGLGKAVGKGLAKKIPGVGVLAGGAFAAERAMKGDWLGAGGELLSGIASIVPGLGTAVSAGIDAGLMARDAGLTPFAKGGIITQPTASLMGEGNKAEGVFPLEGTRGKKTFQMFGEGIFAAQKNNESDFAKLQAKGFKQYFETEGGGKKLGESLKDFFGTLAGGIASLFGGAANAAEFNPAESYLGNAAGGQDLMTLATIAALESGSSQGQADVAQSVYNRLADGTYGKSITDILTRQGQYQVAFKDPTATSGAGTAVADEFKNIKTEDDAVKAMMYYYNKRGQRMTAEQARQKLRGSVSAIQNAELQKKAAQHVGGRTEFLSSGSNVAGAAWRGSGSDNKFFAAYGSGQQMKRGAAAAPTGLFAGASLPSAGAAGGASALAQAAASMKGMSSRSGPNQGRNACVWAVNKVFAKAGIPTPWGSSEYVPTAEEQMIKSGYTQVSSPQPGDLYVAPGQKHIGVILPDGKVISNSSSGAQFSWVDTIAGYNSSYGGKGKLYRMPQGLARKPANKPAGTPTPTAASPAKPSPRASTRVSPGSLQAAAPDTGTPMMAASQQVAMGTMGLTTQGGGATIINNYYGGGGQSGGVNPNGVSPGIGMDGTGTSIFQELKIRALA